jgi:outer membrane biosynthesis protein TonB
LRRELAASGFAHLALIAAAVIGMPALMREPFELAPPIPIDIVDISEVPKTIRPVDVAKPKEPEKLPEPAPVKSEPPPPPKPQARAEAPPDAVPPVPEEKKAEPVKKEEAPKPKDKPAPKPAEAAPKKQEPKPDFNSLLANLTPKESETPRQNPVAENEQPTAASRAVGQLADTLSMTEEEALRRQIERCWVVPVGARDAQNLAVELRVEVGPDRMVRGVQIIDQRRYGSDPFFRAAADSARRAMQNPQCQPLLLPPEKYQQWRVMTLRFDPKDMVGS